MGFVHIVMCTKKEKQYFKNIYIAPSFIEMDLSSRIQIQNYRSKHKT